MRKALGTHRYPRSPIIPLVLALAACLAMSLASEAAPVEIQDAIAWYDTLGYPNAKDLPYIRVATSA